MYGMNVPGLTGPPSPAQRAWNRYVREFSTRFPDYAALAPSVFPITYTNAMEATLKALEAVDGDLGDGQKAFQAALARTELDAPNGHIRLDPNRQAIAPNYLQRVARGPSGLTMRTVETLGGVEQTFNGYFGSNAPLGRDSVKCRKGAPPAWAQRG
jgi:branched-chain amino acid transport system substrate-binding protein